MRMSDDTEPNSTISEISIKSEDGREFNLEQFHLKIESFISQTITLVGYKDGVAVTSNPINLVLSSSTITTTDGVEIAVFVLDTLVDLTSNQEFENIDEIRLTSNNPTRTFWYFDNIVISEVIVLSPPVITNVVSDNENRTYHTGEQIFIEVFFNKPVMVDGTPILELETGNVDRTATYLHQNLPNSLIFMYQVQAGDVTGDLDYNSTTALKLNGGSIWGDDKATLTLPDIGTVNSISGSKDIVVDASAPILSNTAHSNITPTSVKIQSQSNRDGQLYCVITTSATTPTANQVELGQDESGTKAFEYQNSSIPANTLHEFDIVGLNSNTTYYYYCMVSDNFGNRSLVSEGNFTTSEYRITIAKNSDGAENNIGMPSSMRLTVSVNPSNSTGGSITGDINYSGSALNGSDYALGTASFSIANGADSALIILDVIEDSTHEDNESVIVTLSNPSIGTITQSVAIAIIIDDDIYVDQTPNPFSFGSKIDQELNTQIQSNAITLSGMDNNMTLSMSGGEYQINGGAWSSGTSTVDNGDSVKVRTTSSANYSTKVVATLTVATVSADFEVTTKRQPVTNFAPTISAVSTTIAMDDTQIIQLFATGELNDSNGQDLSITLTLDNRDTGKLSNSKIESGSIADVQKALRAITFMPTENIAPVEELNQTLITLSVSDGSLVTTHILEVNVTSVNNKPEIKTVLHDEAMIQGVTQTFNITIADRDYDDLNLTVTTDNSNIAMITTHFNNPIVDADYKVNSFPIEVKAIGEGNATITVILSDGNLSTIQSFKVEVPLIIAEKSETNSSEENVTEPISEPENNATQENNTSEQKPSNPESNATLPISSDDNSTEEQSPIEDTSDETVGVEEQSIVIHNALVELAQRLDGDIKESEKETKVTLALADQKVEIKLNKSSGCIEVVIKDKNTKERQKFTINLKKSETLIDDEGNLLIKILSNTKKWIETRVGSDGKVEHSVYYSEKHTGIIFDVDANTTIESQFEQDGTLFKAIVVTNKRGKSKTKFIKINLNTGQQEEYSTLRKDREFDHGSEVEILKKDGKVYIKSKVNIDGDLVIE